MDLVCFRSIDSISNPRLLAKALDASIEPSLFLPNLKLSSSQQTNNKSRVVFVASFYAGGLNLNDPEFKKRSYSSDSAYQASKQADRMLAFAWSKQCDDILFSSFRIAFALVQAEMERVIHRKCRAFNEK